VLSGALGLLFLITILFLNSSVHAAKESDQYELLAKGMQLIQEDKGDAAVEIFKKVPAPAPGEDAGAFVRSRMEAAKILFSKKDYKDSSVMCHEILVLLPDNLEAKNLLAEIQETQTPEWLLFIKDMKTFLPTLVKATVMTLLLVFITMAISPIGGLFIALGRISRIRILSSFFWCYIWIFRGTPLAATARKIRAPRETPSTDGRWRLKVGTSPSARTLLARSARRTRRRPSWCDLNTRR